MLPSSYTSSFQRVFVGAAIFLPAGGERMSSKSAEAAPPAPRKPPFGSCWGCRVLSGLALMGSGFWVYLGPRRVMKQRIPPNMWHITQMTFALGLVSWGLVLIVNPVGHQLQKKE